MTGLYSRWAIMIGLTLVLAFMTYNRYQQHLSTVPFKDLMSGPSVSEEVRIQGMVKSGTLNGDTTQGQATFELVQDSMTLPVHIYFAYMFGGMVRKMGCKIRPYERHKGETDRVIEKAVDILADAFSGNRSREEAVEAVVSLFEQIETVELPQESSRPKVAIFGDLYARDNHVFNQDLIHQTCC